MPVRHPALPVDRPDRDAAIPAPHPAATPGRIQAGTRGRVAVVDIGSNSIRLVVYDRLARSLTPVFNEKVLCGLGRDLGRTGRLHGEGKALAVQNLARFTRLMRGMEVAQADVLATAAVREAEDGPAFVAEVERRTGLPVSVLDGPEEARLSALGVVSGTADPDGVMGDLGGGSLELVGIDRGRTHPGVTLPLGPFRLMGGKSDRPAARETIRAAFAQYPWLAEYAGRTLYPVGGNWRMLAKIQLARRKHPVHVIHQYTVPAAEMLELAQLIGRQGRASLERMPGVSKRRLETLPYAALVMEGLMEAMRPEQISFSAFGLREGFLFSHLPPAQQRQDPLIAGASDIARRLDRFGKDDPLVSWIAPAFPDAPPNLARLRRAACLLSDIGWAEHPDYRAQHAFLRALRLPIAGVDHAERAFIAGALYARYGGNPGDKLTQPALALMPPNWADQAKQVGLSLRLAHTLCGGAAALLAGTALELTAETLLLWLPEDREALAGDAVRRQLEAVARMLGRDGRIVVAQA